MASSNSQHPNQEVSFTIDGETFRTADRHQTARTLLELAGLDPARYDLGQLRGAKPQTQRFGDDDRVNIQDGARFVSICHSAQVA